VHHRLSACTWSPDGRWIACAEGNPLYRRVGPNFGNNAPSRVLLFPAAGGRPVPLTDGMAQNEGPVWLDARRLLFLSNREGTRDVYAMSLGRAGKPTGGVERLTTGLDPQAISLSHDGHQMAYAVYTNRANIWSVPVPAGPPVSVASAVPVTSGNQVVEGMKVSRGGQWLLYDSNLRGSFDIYRMRLPAGEPEQLTSDPGDEFMPDLSPDGKFLAYHTFKTGTRDVFVRSLESGTVTQVTATAADEGRPMWSPRGDALAFTDLNLERFTAWVVRRDQGDQWGSPVQVATAAGFCDWSPRGDRLYCMRQEGGILEVPIGGGPPKVLYATLPGGDDPFVLDVRLAPDGRTIFFKSLSEGGRAGIWSIPVQGGRPRLLVRFDDATRPSDRVDFATDGRRLYFPIQDKQSDIWVAELLRP